MRSKKVGREEEGKKMLFAFMQKRKGQRKRQRQKEKHGNVSRSH
jgi:hypothetical protein